MLKKLLISILLSLVFTNTVFAGDLTITCDNDKCETVPGGEAALFAEYEFPNYDIKPGDIIKRQITVNNFNAENCNLYLVIKNTVKLLSYSLDEVLDTVIKDSNIEYYGKVSGTGGATGDKTLTDLYSDGVIYLGTITPGLSRVYDWIVSIDTGVGNEYQRAKTKFDFDMTFECGSPFNPTPTPSTTPTSTPTSSPSPGKQSSLGINRPTCENLNFEVTYDAKNDGNPSEGIEVKFSYLGNQQTVKTNINGRASVFFTYSGAGEVKAEALDGYATLTDNIADLICATGIGGGLVAGLTTAVEEFSGVVAGAMESLWDEGQKLPGLIMGEQQGEVKGEDDACCPLIEPLWWIVLMMQTLFLVRFYMQRIKAVDKGGWLLVTLAASVLTIIIHWIGHPWFINRGYMESPYCNWVWLMAIINGLILGSVFSFVYKEEHEAK